MKKLYLFTISFFLLTNFAAIQDAFAQKSIRIALKETGNSSYPWPNWNSDVDCDGLPLDDSEWEWLFTTTGTDFCEEDDGNDMKTNNYGAGVNLYGPFYHYSRDCWPTGNFNIQFRGQEDDGVSNCDVEGCAGYRSDSRAYKAWNSGNGNYALNTNGGWDNLCVTTTCDCPHSITYCYDAQQEINGSWDALNLDGNGYVNNQSCATAKDLTSTSSYAGQARECRTIWYRYTAPAGLASVTVSSSSGGSMGARTSCGGGDIATGSGSVTVNCPSNGTTYYFYVASGGTFTTVSRSTSTISGSNVSGTTVTNTSCSGTVPIYMGTNTTGNVVTNQENRCVSYTWYRYVLTASDDYLTFNPSSSSDVRVYYSASGNCTGCQVASGSGSASVDEPQPGTYYVRVTANTNNVSINVTRGGTASNDYIWNATNLGAMPAGGGTLSLNTNNFGSSAESGEPNQNTADSDNETDWFKFTTGAIVPSKVDIATIENGDNIDSDFHVYKLNDNGYVFPRCNVNWGKLTSLGDGDGGDNIACVGSYDSYRTICVDPNSTYYIQVRGYENGGLCANEHTGDFQVRAVGSTTAKGFDNLCSPHDFGTIGNGFNVSTYYNNSCLGTQGGEPRTGDMSHTMWYKFRTPANGLESVTVEMAEAGEGANYFAVALYQASSCSFGGLTERAFDRWCFFGSNDGDISYNCLPGNTDFYIQAGTGYNFAACTDLIDGGRGTGRYRVTLKSSSYSTGPDNVCGADNLGVMNTSSGSFTRNNQSNICAGTESGEMGGGQKTVWYYFTTGATVGRNVTFNVDAETNGFDSEVYIYELCGPACSGTPNWGNFNELDNFWDGLLVPALGIGEWDANGTISGEIKPNSTYYIRVDGVDLYGGLDGGFDLDVNWSGSFNGNDAFCNATDLGTLTNGGTLSQNNFNNYNASAEENCSLNEPNVDEDDETVWFKFTTNGTPPATIDVDVSADGGTGQGGACIAGEIVAGWVKVYEETGTISCPFTPGTNGFSQIGEPADVSTGIDVSDVTIICPTPNTTYWAQVDLGGLSTCDRAQFDIVINGDGYEQGPDAMCSAISLGTLNPGGSLSRNNFSNYCATDEAGEPNTDGGDETVWYKFTTGPNSGVRMDVDVDAEFGSGAGGACVLGEISAGWVRIYRDNGGACGFGNLTQVGENNDITTITQDHFFLDCPAPNTTYYIQIETGGLSTCDMAKFDVTVSLDSQLLPVNDDLCDAFDLLTLNNQATITASALNGGNTFTTFCSSKQAGEPNVDHGEGQADEEGSVWFKFKPAGILGGDHEIGAKVFIEATEVAEVALIEQLWIRLYEDPTGCASVNDLIELDNKEDEEYYTPEALLIDDCATSQIGDAVPRTRFYGCLEPGKTYYLQVIVRESALGISTDLGLADERGHFDITITNSRTVPDNNNDFVDATTYPVIPGTTSPNNLAYGAPAVLQDVNNLCADVEAWELTTPDIPELDHTVWYGFIAPASGSVQFQVVDAGTADPEESIEPQLTIFNSQLEGNWTGGHPHPTQDILLEYNADDDFFGGEDGQITWADHVLVTCLTPGNTYYARIDGAIDFTGYCAEIEAIDGDEMRGVYDIHMRDRDIWEGNNLICSVDPASGSFQQRYDITHTSNQTAGDLNVWNGCGSTITIDLDNQSNYCGDNQNEADINPWSDAIDKTVWYSFIAPGTGMVTVDIINIFDCWGDITQPGKRPYLDARVAIYDINDGFGCLDINSGLGTSVTLMGESESDGILDINCIGLDEELEVDCLIPGRRYYLVVDGKSRTGNPDGEMGEFHIEMTNTIEDFFSFEERDPQPPALNDLLCNAIHLGDPTGGGVDTDVADGTYPSPARGCANSENTYCAGTGGGEPDINGFTFWGTDHTVWYTFTAPASGAINIKVDGDVHGNSDQLAPQIAVFETSDQVTPCAGTLFDIFAGPLISDGFSTTYDTEVDPLPILPDGPLNCLEPGHTYFLMVDGGPLALELFSTHGTFEVEITEAVPTEFAPSHDDICDAKVINPFTSVGHGGAPVNLYPDTNRCASREFHIPEPSTFSRDRTVWYEFTTPVNPAGSNGNGTYAIDIQVTSDWPWPFGDAMDPQIAVYESSDDLCTGTITEFYSDYDIFNIPFIESLNVQCMLPNTTYWIMVDGSGLNPQGFFELDVTEDLDPTPIAVNDNICQAVDLGTIPVGFGGSIGNPGVDEYNNFCTDTEAGEPDPNWLLINNIDNTVWFEFMTPNNGQNINVDFDLNSDGLGSGDEVDLQIALYQSSDGTCSGAMYEIDSEYDPTILFCLDGLCDEDLDDICLAPNTKYFLQVDGSFLNRMGYFTIEIINDGFPGGPVNDNFCSATPMPAFVGGVSFLDDETNACGTIENGEPMVGHPLIIANGRRTVWYSFVAPLSGRVEITTIDDDGFLGFGGIDPSWALYEYTGGCPVNFGGFTQLENSYWPTIGVVNPDDEDDWRCLWPGQTYYIQVDGTVLGDDGVFDIEVRDLYPNYTTTGPEPTNNTSCTPTALTVQSQSCAFEAGTWQPFDYGEATRSRANVAGCGSNCGDTWFTFNMPAIDPMCPGNVSFVKVEGRDYLNIFPTIECLGEIFSRSDLSVIAYRGTCGALTEIECSVSSSETVVGEVDFTIAGTPGEQIWLQVFSNNGNCFDDDDFDLCVSQRFSADDCADALLDTMDYNEEYCWDIRDATGEDPGAGDPGYYLGGVTPNVTDNSAYFQFVTDDYCLGYKVIIRIDDAGGLSEGGDCNNPGPFETPSGEMQYTLFEDGTPCDNVFDARVDFEDIDDCEPGFAGSIYWEHTYYVTESASLQGDSVHSNSTYIIQIESTNRDIIDGTIEVQKLCEGREWEYVTSIGKTVSDGYCTDQDGWRHYYDDNNTTVATGATLANSATEFSGVQGQDDWEYGNYTSFQTENFTQLPVWTGFVWQNTGTILNFPQLDANGGHPQIEQPQLTWAVRRWTSNYTGTIEISGDFYDRDNGCGDGANVRIFKNTVQQMEYLNIPTSSTPYSITVDVVPGDHIDFVIDPRFDGGCDDTHFTGLIEATVNKHFEDDILIFSLHPNGNTFDGVATIDLYNNYHSRLAPTEASWVMRRLWDFEITSGSINPLNPVRVRFYYEQYEKQEIITAALAYAASQTPALIYEPFEWFKSANGVTFDPDQHITAQRVISEYGSASGSAVTGAASYTPTLAPQLFEFAEDADAVNYSGPGNAYDVDNVWCNGVQWVEIGGLTGFSGGSGATGAGFNQSPLPVELVSFVGWNDGPVNQLEWVTASEINTDLFVVERSADGINFTDIGEVEGHGTTIEEHTYNLTDFTPIQGVNYYRLRIIDFDGTFEYSPVITIELNTNDIRTSIITMYPNPTLDVINIQLQSAKQTTFDMLVLDVTGRMVYSGEVEVHAGLNAPFILDASDYTNGVYIISMTDVSNGEKMEAKFIKQ